MRVRFPCLPTLVLALVACSDQPAAPALPADPPVPAPLAQITCTGDFRAGTFSCEPARGVPGGARGALVVVGGQNQFVRLTTSDTRSSSGTMSTTVTVQNLMVTPMGTLDGTTPQATGVEVFFATEPTSGVTVVNATGLGTFTGTNQPFFRYAAEALGPDSILRSEETSGGMEWQFRGNGVSTFTFTVYVQALMPDDVPPVVHFERMAAEFNYCGLDGAGLGFCWGSNQYGELGVGTDAITWRYEVPAPMLMPAGVRFAAIHTGNSNACALGFNGTAYCWGSPYSGELGIGPTTDSRVYTPVPVVMPPGVSFVEMSKGMDFACALSAAGIAYCWGSDTAGRLGLGDNDNTGSRDVPTQAEMPAGVTFHGMESGWMHTCALGSDGKAYCWGHDGDGKLGTAHGTSPYGPGAVVSPPGVTFTAISAGSNSTCALGNDLNAYCWGQTLNGRLGNGGSTTLVSSQKTPVKVALPPGVVLTAIDVGVRHACGLSTTGAAWCWGSDEYGQLGNGSTTTADQSSPVAVTMPAGVTFSSIAAGQVRTCATSAGYAYCWGSSDPAVPSTEPSPVVGTH